MNGPDHYRAAERLIECESLGESSSQAKWSLELARLHAALAQVAATALSSDNREWLEVAGHRFGDMSPTSHVQDRT